MSSTHNKKSVDVQAFIDRHPMSGFQWRILILCFLVATLDGLDTAIGGFIAPVLREEWALTTAQLNPLLGAVLLGLMLGAFAAGPLADRFGRKMVLLVSVLFFSGWSLASATAGDVQTLTVLRFLTGLGLGGAMPNAITLVSEYCPVRRRSLMVTLMFCGFTLGSALSGVLVAHLLPLVGWRAVLMLGGLLPLLFLPMLMAWLPESVRFLIARRMVPDRVTDILRRIAPLPANVQLEVPPQAKDSPVREILQGHLKYGTLLLWGTFFTGFMIIYLLTNWLPTLIRETGQAMSDAALAGAMFQVGGTLGAIILGATMDRIDAWKVLTTAYIGGTLTLLAISQFYQHFSVLLACVAAMGFCISGSQVGANALAANFYPTTSRATGVAWCHGVGRIGSIAGTLAGGTLLSAGIGLNGIFLWLMVPALLAATAVFLMGRRYRALPKIKGEYGAIV
ncbi:TPA: aromatic acid/H+ symport family MFS transporter [Pseudomonas aeruginosa]|uniref:MFS transporter n=1 Tax=Pseudomonas TaxID=286 RepID=UPI0009986B4A|nr:MULTISPECIES: aromatic acid/H+ symport family MFS transporter [Pseudomonas]MBK3434648.1 aromatic acid/H+ symport family MFS transporter [Pseudomonas fluorescens]MBJ2204535.1 aromatic acid/H+ symport family MFS transporter [Pseudomonas carnis]MBK3468651.1 aromatic acid/H+ symport family MFS transporter [Pseudomonas sp. MF6776]MBW9241449.1 aromatic acid/H+ symport family MFS transporter [Pseudomonas carnis]MDH0797860.1 aromatic acid/H+ symport family MFS transporter [Pseudomonas carnis]